jgi:transcriptional regulator with XRE-family HTH domain
MNGILENIKKIRTERPYSQEYMADKLGIDQVGYGLIENGKRKLKYETLEQIAIIFGMNVIDIITHPKKYVDVDSLVMENKTGKVAVMFEVSPINREQLLRIVLDDNNKTL